MPTLVLRARKKSEREDFIRKMKADAKARGIEIRLVRYGRTGVRVSGFEEDLEALRELVAPAGSRAVS